MCTYTHCLGWIKDGSLCISMVVFWILDLISTVYVQHIGIATLQGLYLLKRRHLTGLGVLNIKLRRSDSSLRSERESIYQLPGVIVVKRDPDSWRIGKPSMSDNHQIECWSIHYRDITCASSRHTLLAIRLFVKKACSDKKHRKHRSYSPATDGFPSQRASN